MTAAPPPRRRSEAATARRLLLGILLPPLLVALVAGCWYAWRVVYEIIHVNDDRAVVDTGNLTAWQDQVQASQILRDTAAATGLDVQLLYPGSIGEQWCQRVDGKNGTTYSLDDLTHEGPVDSQAVIAAAVAYWQHLGLKIIGAPGTFSPTDSDSAWAMTPTGASIEVRTGPDATTWFTGMSGCGLVGGGPTPLPSATLLPVGSGVPVRGSATP